MSVYWASLIDKRQTLEDGQLEMTGPKELMVPKSSAERIGNLFRDIDHLPSHSDHRGLVRFEHARDERYLSVIEKIRSIVASAAEVPRTQQEEKTTRM